MKKRKQTVLAKKQLKRLFVPHKANHFRPHVVRIRGLTIVFAALLVVQLGYGLITTGHVAILGRVTTVDTTQLIAETNNARAQSGLPALASNEDLNKAAALKAQDMFTYDYWSHNSPTGVSPWKWLGDVGYGYSVAGENLAKNYPNAAATVNAWMASDSHRANILNQDYNEVGFAVSQGTLEGRDTTLVVAYYGKPRVLAAETNAAPATFLNTAPINNGVGNIFTYFGSALQSLTPATLGAIAVLGFLALVAAVAHHFRKQLPKEWRKTWKAHHGMFTVIGLVGVGVILVLATGGGQI